MDTQSFRLYRNINELPLRNYIDCLVNENLYALVISGHPEYSELQTVWVNIQQQYADASGDQEYALYIDLLKQVTLVNAKYQMILGVVEVMGYHYDDRLARLLNEELNANFIFDPTDRESYDKLLKRCINRSKSLKVQLDLVTISFESVKKKFEGGQKPNQDYFHAILITLSDYAGYHLTDSISVFEFCDRIKRLNNGRKANKSVRRP